MSQKVEFSWQQIAINIALTSNFKKPQSFLRHQTSDSQGYATRAYIHVGVFKPQNTDNSCRFFGTNADEKKTSHIQART